MGPLK